MEVIRTKNGDRALLVYLLDAQGVDESALESAIEFALAENEVGEVERGATILDELETAKTVETVLTAENWRRSVRVGAVEGAILASLYFAQQPKPVPLPIIGLEEEEGEEEPEPEPEPEQLNLPGVVCEELAERFPGLRVGASSFVIKQDSASSTSSSKNPRSFKDFAAFCFFWLEAIVLLLVDSRNPSLRRVLKYF